MSAIRLEQVSRQFGPARWGVRDLDLDIRDGELLAVVGASGCGKTTSLRLIAGLETPSSGEILFAGRSVASVAPGARNVAFVFQTPALQPHLRAREALAFGLSWRPARGEPRQEKERVEDVIERFGLRPLLDRKVETLSGGERQRVALGRALARSADVYLLDEPLSNLDGPVRAEARRRIAELQKQRRMTVVYVTHDQSEALAIADRVGVMVEGRIEQIDAPQAVYAMPASRRVASLLTGAGVSFLEGRLTRRNDAGWFENTDGGVAAPAAIGPEREITLGVRAENVRLSADAGSEPDARWSCWNALAQVAATEFLGDRRLVRVRWPSGAQVVSLVAAEENWNVGDNVRVAFQTDRMLWFDGSTAPQPRLN